MNTNSEPIPRYRPPLERVLTACVIIVTALFAGSLWLAHYPAARIAAFSVSLGLTLLLNRWLTGSVIPTRPASAAAEATLRLAAIRSLLQIGMLSFSVAVTGGIHSPFLVLVIGPYTGILHVEGWSRSARFALGGLAVATIAMAALPAAWFGPRIAEPAAALLCALALVSMLALQSVFFVAIGAQLEASRREVELAREESVRQALGRARELEQLSAQLSHELKNPLGAIKTFVQLSARRATDADSREQLRLADGEIERMRLILQGYLSFSRPLEKLQRAPVDLAALADELLQLLAPRARAAGVRMTRAGSGSIDADVRKMREGLFNLIANALEATPPGGRVELIIEASAQGTRVLVRDTGRGMPPEVLERIGTPFFTTRPEGSGLGVALARAAFEQHGGSLGYSSRLGSGSVATVQLPASVAG